MQPKPAELSTVTQYPACDHPDELLTNIVQVEMAVHYVNGMKQSDFAELYHCAKCGRVIDLGTNPVEITGDQLYQILFKQRDAVLDALAEIDGLSETARKILEQ